MNQRNKPSITESIQEILRLFFQGKVKELMLCETENTLLQFFRYCFVGGIATIVDWGTLYCIEKIGVHYMIAAVIAFVFGLVCNYCLSKFMVFNGSETKLSAKKEFLAYGIIGVIGLVITLVLMYVMTEWLKMYFMVSKVIATVLVLVWNFGARKYFVY